MQPCNINARIKKYFIGDTYRYIYYNAPALLPRKNAEGYAERQIFLDTLNKDPNCRGLVIEEMKIQWDI